MRLEHLFEISVSIRPMISAGMTSAGERIIADVDGGTFEGPKLLGLAAGADGRQEFFFE